MLRIRHRVLSAYLRLIDDPIATGRTYVCSANGEEMRHLFGDAPDLTNFDVRPLGSASLQMDIQDMSPVADGSVDCFVALHVLNHVADDEKALAEIARILKPDGGVFLVMVPFRRGAATQKLDDITVPYGADALAQYGVGTYRRYGLDDFRKLLERFFVVSEFSFADPIVRAQDTVFQARRLS